MREYIKYNKVRVKLMFLLAALLLTACSDDFTDDSSEVAEGDVLQLVAFRQTPKDVDGVATRTTYPSNYSVYTGSERIGVYMTQCFPAAVPNKLGKFRYSNGQWITSQIAVSSGTQYYIYGYMPINENVNTAIARISGKDFDEGAVITFSNLSIFSSDDLCVVTGVKGFTSMEDAEEGYVDTGAFGYLGQAKDHNFLCLLLDHLYAKAIFTITVAKEYDEVRTIKLKTMTLKVGSYSSANVSVTLRPKSESNTEVVSTEWDLQGSGSEFPIFSDATDDGTLSTAVKTLKNCFFISDPTLAEGYTLECEYDVYDKKGNLLQSRTAENKLPSSLMQPGAGYQKTIKLTVNPTYLYVLSDPDLDNPTIKVEQ